MKFFYRLLFFPVFILALVGCKDDDDQTIPTLSAKDGFSLVLPYDVNKGANLTFTASDDWTISSTGISSWLSFSKTSGGDGENTILVKARNYNCTNEDEHYSFTITSTNAKGTTNVDVTVTHEPVFRVASLSYEADPKGETLHISVKTKANILSSLFVLCDKEFESMWDQSELPSNAKGKVEGQVKGSEKKRMRVAATRAGASGDEYVLDFVIKPNTTSHVRTGSFWLGTGDDESMLSDMITVSQKALDTYSSQDMETDDGKVTQLQKHKVGKGVPIVIMGDGFVDKDIKEGKFREVTNKALEALFSKHPLKSLRDYFDVYEVTAVSYHASSAFWDIMDLSTFKTAFSVGVAQEYPNSVYIGKLNTGDEKKIKEYAKKAIDGNKINDVTIVMLVNDIFTGGITSYSTYLFTTGYMDVPTGCGISYVTLSDIMRPHDDAQYALTLLHEFGHGFAKLADEYVSDERKWYDLESGKDNLILYQNSGYNRNVSLESDVTKTPWADFAADSRYDFEKLGCYEGGEYQATGVYRATESSIMDGGWGFSGFNVASRVMIYKRCMRLAYGDSWEFNYEDFVKFDLEKAKQSMKI